MMIADELENAFDEHDDEENEEEEELELEELGEPTLKIVGSEETACPNCGHEVGEESACDHCGAILFNDGDSDTLLDDSSDEMDSY